MSHAPGDLVVMHGDLLCDDDTLPVAGGTLGRVVDAHNGLVTVEFAALCLRSDLPADAVMPA